MTGFSTVLVQHSPCDRSQHGPRDQIQQRGDRGHSHSQNASRSAATTQGGLVAPNQLSESEADEDWVSLVNPHLTQEERDELSSGDSNSEMDEPLSDTVREETQSFLELAFQKTASLHQRKKWLETFP